MTEQSPFVVVRDKSDGSTSGDKSLPSESDLLESLSALMDDEGDELEVRRVVKALATTPELSECWRRYHVVRASLQQDVHSVPSVNLLANIHAKLAEDSLNVPKASWSRLFSGRLLRIAGQGLIAASVAGAVLLGVPAMQMAFNSGNSAAPAMVAENISVARQVAPSSNDKLPVFNGDYNNATPTRTVSLDADARTRLARAVQNFSGTAAVINSNSTPMFSSQLEPFRPSQSKESGVSANPSLDNNRR